MQRSTERILTTHTGSLPRPPALNEILEGHDQREARAMPGYDQQLKTAVDWVVRQQVATCIDSVNDGEAGKVGYATYVTERLTGYDGPNRPQPPQVEAAMFPEYYQTVAPNLLSRRSCNGPITWHGDALVQEDIANLKAAVQGVSVQEVFMSAVSPGLMPTFLPNEYYPNDEAYIFAVADAIKHEYKAIVDAGFILQLDCPDLGSGWNRPVFADVTMEDFVKVAEMHIAALNHAIEGLPSDRVRVHLCWGNAERPHVRDIPLARIIDAVYQAKADGISFEGANPRHEHEWTVFRDHPLPAGKILYPGVLDSTTNFVEHPELIAQRLERYANLVGKENVVASTDCGFATSARTNYQVHPTVTWAKFQAMAEGAQIASGHLWN